MFFNRNLMPARLMLAIALILPLSGCSWLRDQPKGTSQIKSKALDLTCLQVAPQQLRSLLEGEYTDSPADQAQVQEIWDCLDHALETFSKHTRGAKPGVYTAKELQLFANRYLPADKPLSNNFTTAIFRLKQAVLGGTDHELTADEINGNAQRGVKGLRDKLNEFGGMIKPLAPHMGVLLSRAQAESADKPRAAAALNTFVLDVADLLSDSVNALQWVDLSLFVSELDKFTRKDKATALTFVHEQLEVYQYFKLLLVGGNEFRIENSKWRPIFSAISHFYNALFLSNNTVETLEALAIEVQSTEAEQKKAVDKLSDHFDRLRKDKYLASQVQVTTLSDRFGKLLVLNAIIFPRSQGSLALKTFLGSPGLRKLAGYLLDQVNAVRADASDPAKIQALADNLVHFITQAANENADGGAQTPIAFGPLKDYVQSLRPLFADEKEFEAALLAIDLFKNTAPILCGKESDNYLPKDLKDVIQKSVDLFLAWRKESKNSVFESIGQTFDVILRKPHIQTAKLEQIENSVQIAERLLQIMAIEAPIRWSELLEQIRAGFSIKALLFGNNDRAISAFEIKTLSDLWVPFRSTEPLHRQIEALADRLNDNTFSTVPFDKLVPAVERILPPEQKLSKLRIDGDTLGIVKSVLVGGSDKTLESSEYAPLARLAAKAASRMDLWESFRRRDNLEKSFTELASLLEETKFVPVTFKKLVPAVNRFLPPESGIKLDAETLGLLKHVAIGGSDQVLDGKEYAPLARLAAKAMRRPALWDEFRRGDDLARSLRELATLLEDNTFAPVRFDRLVPAINRFLPADRQIESFGVDADIIGLAKAALIGGSPTTLERGDYAPLTRIAANVMARLQPIQKQLPAKFALGLNARSLELTAAAIDGVADSVQKIEYLKIKPLLAAYIKRMGYQVKEPTLDHLLIGLSHRMLGRKKTPKPAAVGGFMTPAELRSINVLLRNTQKDWEEIEKVYAGINPTTGTLPREHLLRALPSAALREIVARMPAVLDGKDFLIHFTGSKPASDYSSYDLIYKSFMRRVLQWLFPAYQIQADAGAASGRLTFDDVVDLLDDINPLIQDLKLSFAVNPSRVTAVKRMQTINLFTKTGNGDDYMDIDETAEFLTITTGGRVLLDRELDKLKSGCKIDPRLTAEEKIPYPCLVNNFTRPAYFAQAYGDVVPELVRQYNRYSDEDRRLFVESLFTAADPDWRDKKEMTYAEFETFIAAPYFAESIFERLDLDHSQVINFTEGMGGFPLFCREIKRAAGPSVRGSCENGYPNQIEAVYGHLLFRGEPPRGPKPGDSLIRRAREIIRVLAWFRYWRRLNRDPEYRNARPPQLQRKDLLKIISNLATATATGSELDLGPQGEEETLRSAPAEAAESEQEIEDGLRD